MDEPQPIPACCGWYREGARKAVVGMVAAWQRGEPLYAMQSLTYAQVLSLTPYIGRCGPIERSLKCDRS